MTFVDRVQKWVHDYLKRRSHLYARFKVHLRPREASFAAVPERAAFQPPVLPIPDVDPQISCDVLMRIKSFMRDTFPDAPILR